MLGYVLCSIVSFYDNYLFQLRAAIGDTMCQFFIAEKQDPRLMVCETVNLKHYTVVWIFSWHFYERL